MTREEAIAAAYMNRGSIYTTDDLWEDDESCIIVDSLGNLRYGDGEPVLNESDLPEDDWYDATDLEEQMRANGMLDDCGCCCGIELYDDDF